MSTVNPDLRYSADHEWIDSNSPATIGISQLAADRLGEIVYLDLPEEGTEVTAGEPFGEVESTKSVSELFSPVTGRIVEVNTAIADDPAQLNADAFAAWLIRVEVESEGELLTAAEYAAENGLAL